MVGKPAVRVENLVADEFVGCAVKAVRSALGNHVHDSAEKVSVFWTKVVGLDLEFCDRVLRRNQRRPVKINRVEWCSV
jgi:hypothetical protein